MIESRKRRSPSELQEASEHLHYEVMMFNTLARGLASGISQESVMSYALIEAFALHARVLFAFFYDDHPRPDDMIASDFVEDPTIWLKIRPDVTSTLRPIANRVGKEAAHLTYARLAVAPEDKGWPFVLIARDISSIVLKFLEVVPRQVLAQEWSSYRPFRGETDV